jgi:hypothetical protein
MPDDYYPFRFRNTFGFGETKEQTDVRVVKELAEIYEKRPMLEGAEGFYTLHPEAKGARKFAELNPHTEAARKYHKLQNSLATVASVAMGDPVAMGEDDEDDEDDEDKEDGK